MNNGSVIPFQTRGKSRQVEPPGSELGERGLGVPSSVMFPLTSGLVLQEETISVCNSVSMKVRVSKEGLLQGQVVLPRLLELRGDGNKYKDHLIKPGYWSTCTLKSLLVLQVPKYSESYTNRFYPTYLSYTSGCPKCKMNK